MIRCNRTWPAKAGGVHLCTLLHGHGGTRCIDAVHNVSSPITHTAPSAWERAMARREGRPVQ